MSRLLKLMCLTDEATFESQNAHPLTITANANRYLNDYQVYGKSVQEGTPSPDAPVQVLSVGDLVTSGANAGRYKVPVTVSCGDVTKTTDIYLDAPLRKIGDYADYVDFKNKRVVRRVGEKIFNGTEPFNPQAINHAENTYLFMVRLGTALNKHATGSSSNNLELCNTFIVPKYSVQPSSRNSEGCSFNQAVSLADAFYVRINKDRLSDDQGTTFRNWVKALYNNGTPLKVYYAFEEPVDENADLPKILQFKGENTYRVETSLTPDDLQVKYY